MFPIRQFLKHWRWGVGLLWALPYLLGSSLADDEMSALFFQLRGPQQPNPDIVILAIDDNSIHLADLYSPQELASQPYLTAIAQGWPFPRAVHGAVLDYLVKAGAQKVVFDVVFDSPSRFGTADDRAFQEALNRNRRKVVLAASVNAQLGDGLRLESLAEPLALFQVVGNSLGLANLYPSANGQYSTLAGSETLASQLLTPLKPLPLAITGQPLPSFDLGINYSGPRNSYPNYPYWRVFTQNPAVFRDKIVLIGSTAKDFKDVHPTPVDPLMPGVEIHANGLGTLLSGRGIIPLNGKVGIIPILLLGLVSAWSLGRLPLTGKLIFTAGVITLTFASVYLLWLAYVLFPVTGLLGTVLSLGAIDTVQTGIEEQQKRQRLRKILELRVAAPVLAEILANPDSFAQTLGGKRCQVVILFADIRDFTTLSTAMPPEELVNLLNRYFELMVGAILKEQGTIDKFIGDAVMAEFGTPIFRGAKAETCAAVRAALAMRKALQELRQTLAQEGKPLIFNGVGINIGEVVAGNLGSSQKLEYTVIGDPVNVASRIEGLTKTLGHDILISEAVEQLIQDDFETIALGTFQLKGRSEPVGIYGVMAEK